MTNSWFRVGKAKKGHRENEFHNNCIPCLLDKSRMSTLWDNSNQSHNDSDSALGGKMQREDEARKKCTSALFDNHGRSTLWDNSNETARKKCTSAVFDNPGRSTLWDNSNETYDNSNWSSGEKKRHREDESWNNSTSSCCDNSRESAWWDTSHWSQDNFRLPWWDKQSWSWWSNSKWWGLFCCVLNKIIPISIGIGWNGYRMLVENALTERMLFPSSMPQMSKRPGDEWELVSLISEPSTEDEDELSTAYPPETMKLLEELALQIDIEARTQLTATASSTGILKARISLDEACECQVGEPTDCYPSPNLENKSKDWRVPICGTYSLPYTRMYVFQINDETISATNPVVRCEGDWRPGANDCICFCNLDGTLCDPSVVEAVYCKDCDLRLNGPTQLGTPHNR